jgi:hypothetical protein
MKDIDEITPYDLAFLWTFGPDCKCNLCGKDIKKDALRLVAKVHILTRSANFIVCGMKCRTRFIEHPGSPQYVQETIQRIKKL